jgi:hypothetical protein
MNTDETPREFTIRATGIPGLAVVGVAQPVAVGAAGTRLLPLRLQAPADAQAAGDVAGRENRDARARTQRIEIVVEAVDDARIVRHERSSFAFPR